MIRRKTKIIQIGSVRIGGDHPIAVQSMNNTNPRDIEATVRQILELTEAGCDLTRLAIPDQEAADAFAAIRRRSPIPIVADIHFDYRLALAAIAAGADKIRINPGNIGDAERVRQVALAAKQAGIPIRIGVNSGSLSQAVIDRNGGVNAAAMVESVLEHVQLLEGFDFDQLCLSIKASDPLLTIQAYRQLAARSRYALHVGLTEAGMGLKGTVGSALALGILLSEGVGDTIRVSLTADPVEEIQAGFAILKSLGLRRHGPELISCPTCGRTAVDLQQVAEAVEAKLQSVRHPIRVAVMGCAVNGPGEARHADIGLAGGQGEFLIFRHGQILRKVPQDQAVDALMAEIEQLCAELDRKV